MKELKEQIEKVTGSKATVNGQFRYSISYIEGNENPERMPRDSYDSIQDCIDWADENNVDYYLLVITESDWDNRDAYGSPEYISSVNLQAVVDDNERESLSKYQIY